MRFRGKKNLTEICHKVSLVARSFFIQKGAICAGRIHRQLDAAGARLDRASDLDARIERQVPRVGRQRIALAGMARRVAGLCRRRISAANCPYALFDLRFADDDYWRGRLQAIGSWRVSDDDRVDAEIVDFVRLALFYTWHVASSAGLAAHLLLGMHGNTAEAFRSISVDALPALALAEAPNLTARWSGCRAYWSALISAAAHPDPAALRRVQLSGLQLAAASQLPSEPREV